MKSLVEQYGSEEEARRIFDLWRNNDGWWWWALRSAHDQWRIWASDGWIGTFKRNDKGLITIDLWRGDEAPSQNGIHLFEWQGKGGYMLQDVDGANGYLPSSCVLMACGQNSYTYDAEGHLLNETPSRTRLLWWEWSPFNPWNTYLKVGVAYPTWGLPKNELVATFLDTAGFVKPAFSVAAFVYSHVLSLSVNWTTPDRINEAARRIDEADEAYWRHTQGLP
jgi:hypothetical protein